MSEEERYALRVLAPMREVREAPRGAPEGIDVTRAIVDGRRRIRVRRIATVAAIAGVTAVTVVVVPLTAGALRQRSAPEPATSIPPAVRSMPVPVPIDCTARRLRIPDGRLESVTTGIDPTGRLILGRSFPGAGRGVLIWENGTPRTVAVPGDEQMLVDANSSGSAIGSSRQSGVLTPWVYDRSTVTRLTIDGPAAPLAIAETGRIVGYREGGDRTEHPVAWSSPWAVAADLPLPAGWEGRAVDVTAEGIAVGVVRGPGAEVGREQGYVWQPDGTGGLLPPPVVDGERAVGFRPYAVGPDWVIGAAIYVKPGTTKSLQVQAVQVNLRTGGAERYPTTRQFVPHAGNAAGWLAGQFDGGPATLSDSGVTFLPALSGITGHQLSGVSEDGRVVAGHGLDGKRRTQALVWRCS